MRITHFNGKSTIALGNYYEPRMQKFLRVSLLYEFYLPTYLIEKRKIWIYVKVFLFFLNRHPLVVNTHVKSAKERSFHNYKMLPIAQQFNVLKRGLQLQACSVGRIWRRDGRFKGRVRRHYCMLMYAHAKKWACCV